MVSRREVNKISKMMKRKEYAGFFFGLSVGAFIAAGFLHSAGNPEIAGSTFEYTVERVAHHEFLFNFRNYFAVGAGISFIIGIFMNISVQDLAE